MTLKPGETDFHTSKCRVVAAVTFSFRLLSGESISTLLHCVKFSHNYLLRSDENLSLLLGMEVQRHAIHLEIKRCSKETSTPTLSISSFFCFHSNANITEHTDI